MKKKLLKKRKNPKVVFKFDRDLPWKKGEILSYPGGKLIVTNVYRDNKCKALLRKLGIEFKYHSIKAKSI